MAMLGWCPNKEGALALAYVACHLRKAESPSHSAWPRERALNAAETKEIIAETNGFYKKLLSGETEAGKLWVPKA